METEVKYIFLNPRIVPHSMKTEVDEAFIKPAFEAYKEIVIVKISNTYLGVPLVSVFKNDESVGLCANYKVTITSNPLGN